MSDQDPFEERLRSTLHGPAEPTDAEAFLGGVHRGARVRRTRRAIGAAVATVSLVAVTGVAITSSGVFDDSDDTVATAPTQTTGATDSAPTPSPSVSVKSSPTPTTTPTRTTTTTRSPILPDDILNLDFTATGTAHQYILGSVTGGDCGVVRCPHVFETDDSGASWDDLGELPATPVTGAGTPATVDALRFAGTGTDGWAFAGNLLSTHDGGQTWSPPTLPVEGSVTDLEAWGDDVLAVVETADGARLLHSATTEDTWEVVPYDEQIGLSVDRLAISDIAVSEDAAVLISGPYDEGATSVQVSTDGGLTWEATASEACAAGESAAELSVTADSLWTRCTYGPLVGQPVYSRLVATDDLGGTWVEAGGRYDIDSVLGARDAGAALVVEQIGGPMQESRVFEASTSSSTGSAPISRLDLSGVTSVGFTNPDVGYAFKGETGEIRRTNDGGEHWAAFGVRILN